MASKKKPAPKKAAKALKRLQNPLKKPLLKKPAAKKPVKKTVPKS